MSTSKYIDRICAVGLVITLLVTVLFMNGEKLGLQAVADTDAENYSGTEKFTANDQNGTWTDNAYTTYITLENDTAEIDGNGAYILDGNVVIASAGWYVVTGEFTGGSLVVDTNKSAKVWIRFDNVKMTCEDDACLIVDEADKVFLTLAEGSSNSLESGEDYSEEALADGTGGVIFAHDDLTVNGSGELLITANAKHGIDANDELVITGGVISITAPEDGIHVNDSFRFMEASLTVDAGDDAIHSDGEVYIESGTILIESSYEGIEGLTIEMAGGDVTVYSSDDGLNANGGSDGFMGMGQMMGGFMTGNGGGGHQGRRGNGSQSAASSESEPPASDTDGTQPEGGETDTGGEGPQGGMQPPTGGGPGEDGTELSSSGGEVPEGGMPFPSGMRPGEDGTEFSSSGGEVPEGGMPFPSGMRPGEDGTEFSFSGGEVPEGVMSFPMGGRTGEDGTEFSFSEGEEPEGGMQPPEGGMPQGTDSGASGAEMPAMPENSGMNGTEESGEETSGEDTWIRISGGNLTIINTTGRDADGLDSNGSIYIDGGTIRISLSGGGSNSAIDYGSESGGECIVTGGNLIACGGSSMVEEFSENSTQCAVLYNLSSGGSEDTSFRVLDADGNEILSWDATSSFTSVAFSAPELKVGETITVEAGGATEEITLESTAVTAGTGSMMMGGFR